MRKKWIIGGLVLLVAIAAVWGGSVIYAGIGNNRAPEQFSLSTPIASTPTASAVPEATPSAKAPEAGALAGSWIVGEGSQAGYRVKEVLNGQDVTVVGRTSTVTGQASIDGTSLSAAEVTVDMTTVTTDSSSRDGQFLGILKTSDFPSATFTLTEAVDIAAVANGVASVQAVGDLTIAGVTKSVTAAMEAQRTDNGVEVQGSIPITFSDFGVSAPDLGFVKVENAGTVEMLLQLSR